MEILTGLLWFPVILDTVKYIANLETAAANAVDGFAELVPQRLTNKVKLHLLCHVVEYVLRFGPLVGMTTEKYESYNGEFCPSSVFSNRKNPCRDIVADRVTHERLKHMLLSGVVRVRGDDGNIAWKPVGEKIAKFVRERSNGLLAKAYSCKG